MDFLYRFVFKISRAIHKYTGLVFLLYFAFMGATGVLINHPSLLRGVTVPSTLLPAGYQFTNWNRMALRETEFSQSHPDTVFFSGKAGIFKSVDGGESFTGMSGGLPTGAWFRDTRALLLVERDDGDLLFAGTRGGLYFCNPEDGNWQAVRNESLKDEDIMDIVHAGGRIYAFTSHAAFSADMDQPIPGFKKENLSSAEPAPTQVAMFRFLIKLHDGSVLGLPGKLFVDSIGLILLFLSISALYVWYIPWSRKKFVHSKKPRFFRFFHKYHLKLGIYSSLFLAIIALSGIFIRPPLLVSIIRVQVPAWLYPDSASENWHAKIQKAIYVADEDALLLATKHGFFKGPADLSAPFVKEKIKIPVHGMGAFVLEPLADKKILIGSFSGLFIWDRQNQTGSDMQGNPIMRKRTGRPVGGSMASGSGVQDGKPLFWIDYRKGLQFVDGVKTNAFPMPEAIRESGMSLWHFLFECHNGRIFRGILGKYTWLFITLGGLVLLVTVITGCYDWLFRKVLSKQRKGGRL